jgi:hypothetical protein
MENRSLPLAGGLGGAALLALALNPWSGQNGSLPQAPVQPQVKLASGPGNPAAPTGYSLSHNEQGPWYALCSAFATTDPEDTETTPNHPARPEAGVEEHPPLYANAEHRPEEITEESITRNGIQRKFVPRYHFHAKLSSCLPPLEPNGNQGSRLPLNVLTATIPDPLGSHLALQFDRDIVSLERAAEASGFVFERYWFPWNGLIKTGQNGHTDSQTDSLRQQLREQPGILIFRSFAKTRNAQGFFIPFSSRLIIFLVGETPTAGINKVALTKAIQYTAELACFSQSRLDWSRSSQPPTHKGTISTYRPHTRSDSGGRKFSPSCVENARLGLLGPSFSGSFSSLYRTLHDLRQRSPTAPMFATIISPSTTVDHIRTTFKEELTSEKLGTIRALSPLDRLTQDSIITYLGTLGYHDREVAYLSEDESSYNPGDTKLSGGDRKVDLLTYPRDLSSLRNEWTPATAGITPADISGGATTSAIARFSLHETASNELDSPSAFALDQAAPDIDQALGTLITIIRHRRYRVLIVTATNPMDEIYLLQYVRQNAPDVRLVTYDQDSLMLREANYVRLRGTISISPFPLSSTQLLDTVDTTGFTNSAAEAVYIGTRLFLDALQTNQKVAGRYPATGPSDVNTDLSQMANQASLLPGIYVLGDDSFWPVKQPRAPEGWLFRYQSPLVPWTWYIIVTALIIFAVLHLYALRRVYKRPSPSGSESMVTRLFLRRRFVVSRHSEHLIMDYFRLVANNQLLILLFFVELPSLVLYREFARTDVDQYFVRTIKYGLLVSLSGVTVLLLVASIVLFVRVIKTISSVAINAAPTRRLIVKYSDLGPVIVYLVVTVAIWSLIFFANHNDAVHTAFRTVYVLDGLSPLPVAASVIAAWYLFAVMGVRSARTMISMRVEPIALVLRQQTVAASWVIALEQAQRKLLDEVEAFIRVDGKGLLIMLLNFLILLALQGWAAFRGTDSYWFRGWIVFGGIGLMTSTIAIHFFRVWSVWTSLRSLLTVLGSSPIASGFEHIPENIGSSKFWCSLESRQSHAFQEYTLGLLNRIYAFAPSPIKRTLQPYVEVASLYVDDLLYKVSRDSEETLRGQLLLNACFDAPLCFSPTETNSTSMDDQPREMGGGATGGDCVTLGGWFQEKCEQGDENVRAFAAIRYVALIKYVNTQMRWMLEFVLYAYVLLILGLKTYPFQGEHVIGSVLTIIFTVLFVFSAIMFVQVDSNDLLSRLEHTTPGKANYFEAAQRLLSVGGLPLLAILATQFPVIERFLLSWVRPTIESLH